MTEPKPCTVKGCDATGYHHHGNDGRTFACVTGERCTHPHSPRATYGPVVAAPRLSRKALAARLAAVEAENADLHAEIADKKDRLARQEADPDAAVVEAMARAIRDEYATENGFSPYSAIDETMRNRCRAEARAALKAAREAGAL